MTGRLILRLRKPAPVPPRRSLQTFQHRGTLICSIAWYRIRSNWQASSPLHTAERSAEVLPDNRWRGS
jgi:hypothetical protein